MNSIRARLLALLLGGLAATMLIGGFAVYRTAKAGMTRRLDDDLRAGIAALQALATFGEKGLEFEFDQEPAPLPPDVHFVIRDEQQRIVRQSAGFEPDAEMFTASAGATPVFSEVDLPGGQPGRAATSAFLPRVDVDEEDGPVEGHPTLLHLTAAIDRGPTDRALAALLASLVIVGLFASAVVTGLVWVAVRWGLSPLDQLSRQLGAAGENAISTRFNDDGAPRELLPVYRELNGMLDRVGQTIERERGFADAAAHELRTPLAELRATAEVALRFPDARDAANSLKEALAIGCEMERLVESLLLISRANAGEIRAAKESNAIAPLVARSLERGRQAMDDKRLRITMEIDRSATITAPPEALELIIRNLVDNALHHTPPGGTVSLRCDGTTSGTTVLIVENGPVSLKAEDVTRLFEPFWRLDHARTDRDHVGLGLTVVQRMTHAIGLSVEAGLVGDRLTMRLCAAR